MISFLNGLFTTHLVTKVVSLLLASVLFVFTQQSISDTQTIESLTIRFELAPDLREKYVIENDEVVLKNLKVLGLRKDLAVEIGSLRRGDFVVTKVITDQFRRDYRPDTDPLILIDADLLRAENIPWEFGEEFQIELQQPGRLVMELLKEMTFRPTLSADMKERLKLPESSPFRAADGSLQVEPDWVQPTGEPITTISISGPASLLKNVPVDADQVPPLFLRVADLKDSLRGKTLAEAREPIKIVGIDWAASGIGDRTRLYVRAPLAGSVESLVKSTLQFRCGLKFTPVVAHVTLGITFSTSAKGGLTLADVAQDYSYRGRVNATPFDYQPRGQPITEWSEIGNLALEVTETWRDNQAELAKLFFLEIDVANATKATEGWLEIPIRLKPRSGDAERILANGEVRLPDPMVIFQTKN